MADRKNILFVHYNVQIYNINLHIQNNEDSAEKNTRNSHNKIKGYGQKKKLPMAQRLT